MVFLIERFDVLNLALGLNADCSAMVFLIFGMLFLSLLVIVSMLTVLQWFFWYGLKIVGKIDLGLNADCSAMVFLI